MSILALAAPTLVLFAAGAALVLLLVVMLRLQRRFTLLDVEVERLKKVHQDGAVDARSRLEELSAAVGGLEQEVKPRLEPLASLAPDLGALRETAEALRGRLDVLEARLEARDAGAVDAVAEVRARLDSLEGAAGETAARVRTVDGLLQEARRRLEQAETRRAEPPRPQEPGPGPDLARLDAIERRVAKIEQVGAAPPRVAGAVRPPGEPSRAPGPARTTRSLAEPAVEAEVGGHEEAHADHGAPWVLLLVIALAAVAALLHLLA